MSEFSRQTLKRCEKLGLVSAAAGVLLAILTSIPYDSRGFWADPLSAANGAGWLLVLAGIIGAALSAGHLRTRFFSLDCPIESDRLAMSVAAVAVATFILILIALPLLPTTDPSRLPSEPAARDTIVRQERNLKVLVAAAIILSGACVASAPARRYFGR